MSELAELFARNALVVAAAMGALWIVSLWRRNASIVDPFWGPGFALIAWQSLVLSPPSPRAWLLVALVTIWALRLGGFLLWRNWGHGEDPRYAAMRERHGARFPWISLATVFAFQGLLLWCISLPLQIGIGGGPEPPLGALEIAGVAVWATGLFFEGVGDWQLSRFRADPSNRGKVMDRGLWRYTRHPNYFGDALVWWGLFAVALRASAGWWGLVGPVLMTLLLVRVSGVTLLERSLRERRPDYAAYVARTSAFIPWPPRR